ncbi:MAG: hypothetical protein HC850_04790 [Rhodomicrobium sp.]|nr:hypothetical protein [Rhodomicrobium sp.]
MGLAKDDAARMAELLALRFGDFGGEADRLGPIPPLWLKLAGRGSCRRFKPEPVAPELIDTLCALALAAPSKSDLQQRDIIVIDDAEVRGRIVAMLTGGSLAQDWIAGAPHLLIFCGNNRACVLYTRCAGILSPTTISMPSSTRPATPPSP